MDAVSFARRFPLAVFAERINAAVRRMPRTSRRRIAASRFIWRRCRSGRNRSTPNCETPDGARLAGCSQRWMRSRYDHDQQLEHEENRYEVLRDDVVIQTEHLGRSPCVRWYLTGSSDRSVRGGRPHRRGDDVRLHLRPGRARRRRVLHPRHPPLAARARSSHPFGGLRASRRRMRSSTSWGSYGRASVGPCSQSSPRGVPRRAVRAQWCPASIDFAAGPVAADPMRQRETVVLTGEEATAEFSPDADVAVALLSGIAATASPQQLAHRAASMKSPDSRSRAGRRRSPCGPAPRGRPRARFPSA